MAAQKQKGEVKAADRAASRLIGAVTPVGALRSKLSVGVGEFPDLVEFGRLCGKMGVGLIQILPVNDTGYQSSPYFALTAFALNPIYLRIGDMKEAAGFEAKIAKLAKEYGGAARFPYEKILRAKIALLREIYKTCQKDIEAGAAKSGRLGKWVAANPWVKEYAVFRRLKEQNGERSWVEWKSHQKVSAADIEALWEDKTLKGEHLFWVWVQEALDSQLSKAAKSLKEMGILLEGDLPILMNEDSHDVWAHPEFFNRDLSAGAPPDVYSPDGQNWGFPIYNWAALAKADYAWWKDRLKAAEKYYGAYRIDHVLGFFRIWATPRRETTATLGRFVPCAPVKKRELEELGFDEGRIRWLSRPHVPTGEVWDYLRGNWGGPFQEGDIGYAAGRVFETALERIGNEELWLFRGSIKGEKDIDALDIHPAAKAYLKKAWVNRAFIEYERDTFVPAWLYKESRAYASLSGEEKAKVDDFLDKKDEESEKGWETQGKKLLSVLASSSSMLPCAEDLGAVPSCVPKVLAKLNILGLKVVRWNVQGTPGNVRYIPFGEYPELSVCTAAVHDSSTLREWWDREADQRLFSDFLGVPSLPRVYNPGTARTILLRIAAAASRFRVFQIQDLMHLSTKWYAPDPASERINVPGTNNEFNWTYKLPANIEDIASDTELVNAVKELGSVKPAQVKKEKVKK